MNRSIAITTLVGLLVSTGATVQADPIAPRTGRYHPRVKVGRKVFKEVVKLEKRGKLKVTVKKFEPCKPGVDAVRRIYLGPGGKVRKYQYEGGSDDRGVVASFYYDRRERLVFAFVVATYHNNATVQYRLYLDGRGRRVWQRLSQKGKLQGMYSKRWPEAGMVHKPRKALATPSECKPSGAK